MEINIDDLVAMYKKAVQSKNQTGIDAAEVAVAEALELEAASAKFAAAEAFAAEAIK